MDLNSVYEKIPDCKIPQSLDILQSIAESNRTIASAVAEVIADHYLCSKLHHQKKSLSNSPKDATLPNAHTSPHLSPPISKTPACTSRVTANNKAQRSVDAQHVASPHFEGRTHEPAPLSSRKHFSNSVCSLHTSAYNECTIKSVRPVSTSQTPVHAAVTPSKNTTDNCTPYTESDQSPPPPALVSMQVQETQTRRSLICDLLPALNYASLPANPSNASTTDDTELPDLESSSSSEEIAAKLPEQSGESNPRNTTHEEGVHESRRGALRFRSADMDLLLLEEAVQRNQLLHQSQRLFADLQL